MLDAIITLVDAKHAMAQLDEHHEAQEQVGFADRILLSKTDLVTIDEVNALQARLKRMNLRATIQQLILARHQSISYSIFAALISMQF